jgi:hypothetical protein
MNLLYIQTPGNNQIKRNEQENKIEQPLNIYLKISE